MQVVGGVDDQIPSLPSTAGVEIVSYAKLISQVSYSPISSSNVILFPRCIDMLK